jgi:hypothetical protein
MREQLVRVPFSLAHHGDDLFGMLFDHGPGEPEHEPAVQDKEVLSRKALTLSEGLKKGLDVNGRHEIPGKVHSS